MKLQVKSYIEPVTIEVERGGEVIETLEFECDFSDSNAAKSMETAKEAKEAIDGLDIENDPAKALKVLSELVQPMLDTLLGEGATAKIAKAFGKGYKPKDCAHALLNVYAALNAECAERLNESRVKIVKRYLDEEA